MVSIIENKAKIEGNVEAVNENAGPQGYCQIQVALQKSDDVEGYPNLAKADEGSVITINLRPEQLSDCNIEPGSDFKAQVRKVFGQQYYMESSAESGVNS